MHTLDHPHETSRTYKALIRHGIFTVTAAFVAAYAFSFENSSKTFSESLYKTGIDCLLLGISLSSSLVFAHLCNTYNTPIDHAISKKDMLIGGAISIGLSSTFLLTVFNQGALPQSNSSARAAA